MVIGKLKAYRIRSSCFNNQSLRNRQRLRAKRVLL